MKVSSSLKDKIRIINTKIQGNEDIDEDELFHLGQIIQSEIPNPRLIKDIFLKDLLNLPFRTDFTCYKNYYTTNSIEDLYLHSPKSMAVILGCMIKNELQILTWHDLLKSKNTEGIISLFNFICRLVEHSLIPKNQKQFFFWEKVAQECFVNKNLYGLKAVASALTSVVSSRNYDEKDFSHQLKILIEYTMEDNNFFNFRKLHVNTCLPYIGICVKDFMYMYDACDKDLKDPKMQALIQSYESYCIPDFPGWCDYDFSDNDLDVLQIILSYEKVSDDDIYDIAKSQTLMEKFSRTRSNSRSASRSNSKAGSKASSPNSPKPQHQKSQSELTPSLIRHISGQRAIRSSTSRSERQEQQAP